MAGISTNENGTKILTYYDKSNKQKFIRLGRISKRDADQFKIYFERLINAQKLNVSIDSETLLWLSELSDIYYNKLVAKELVPPRKKSKTLSEFVPNFIQIRSDTVSDATVEIWQQSERSLYLFFGQDKNVASITPNDAASFKAWLITNGRLDGKGGLKPTTAWKRLQHVVAFFDAMVKNDEISKNPFAGVSIPPAVDKERNIHIEEELIYRIMEVLPDAEWRLIVALWRFAGLRASEPLLLRWQDILWDQGKIVVHAHKTKRYVGKAIRIIPIFPELRKPLQDAFDEAAEGDNYIIMRHAPRYMRTVEDRSRLRKIKANLGAVFSGYVERAGLTPWSKIAVNLRASAETDLLNGKYGNIGIQTIAEFMGHSPKVALQHYGRVREEDYHKIAQTPLQKPETASQTAQIVSRDKDKIVLSFDVTELQSYLEAPLYAPLQGAAQGGNEVQGELLALRAVLSQLVQEDAHSGKKEQREASSGNLPFCRSGEDRI